MHAVLPRLASTHLEEEQPVEGGADRLPGRREGLQVGFGAARPLLPGQAF